VADFLKLVVTPWAEVALESASVVAAFAAAYYWYQSTKVRAPYEDNGDFCIIDEDAEGRFDVLETAKLQVRLNKPAALCAGASAFFQALALLAHVIISK
jgi:hypothetical protein